MLRNRMWCAECSRAYDMAVEKCSSCGGKTWPVVIVSDTEATANNGELVELVRHMLSSGLCTCNSCMPELREKMRKLIGVKDEDWSVYFQGIRLGEGDLGLGQPHPKSKNAARGY